MNHAGLYRTLSVVAVLFCWACDPGKDLPDPPTTPPVAQDSLPEPYATPSSTKYAKVIPWPNGQLPQAPDGFVVTKYADGFNNPRLMYVLPNGDVLVSETAAGRITLLRDTNNDGTPDLRNTFLSGLNQPFGIQLIGHDLYVGNTNALVKYAYTDGATSITGSAQQLVSLPTGGHSTRNILANETGSKIYIAVGSSTNVADNGIAAEARRANILEVNPDGSGERVFASGIRNPVGLAWEPVTKKLWTAVNERDGLGDGLVPDYITSVKDGAFYGWPWSYYGQHEDPRRKGENPEMVKKAIVPDLQMGAHTANLGLAFYTGKSFPAKYQGGAFVAQHGSWNSSALVGYQVAFVPFSNGVPSAKRETFLGGFTADVSAGTVYGRPVGVTQLPDGSLLVADDGGNVIWRVAKR